VYTTTLILNNLNSLIYECGEYIAVEMYVLLSCYYQNHRRGIAWCYAIIMQC